ncbi:uncharacterized protein LOC114966130 [Acropora millepora]|uniref:uncharacterized protein LOC114966130 n=1 Tax=Acropora millepora TaxID=45264 RepID=UPI001CF5B199|nr:uncharacterized protein LOC114966130 [Acropora millepora]
MKLFKYSLFGTYYYKGFTLQFTATCCLYSAHVQRPLQMDLKTRCLNDAISCVSGRSVSNHTQGDYDKKLKELVQEVSTDVVDYAVKVESESKNHSIYCSPKRDTNITLVEPIVLPWKCHRGYIMEICDV